METKQEQEIYNIEKEYKEKLKLFFVILHGAGKPLPFPTRAVGIVAYRSNEAFAKLEKEYLVGNPALVGTLNPYDYIAIEDLFRGINTKELSSRIAITGQEKPAPMKLPKIGFEAFKSGLLLASEEYIKDEKDKKVLEKIISKIKPPKQGQ